MKRIIGVLLIILPFSTFAEDVPYCVIDDYGIVGAKPISEKSIKSESAAIGTITKVTGNISFSETTVNIPAKLGTRFGVKHTFYNIPKGERLKTVINHPEMLSPSGELKKTSGGPKRPTDNGTSYSFDTEEELLPGIWEFSFFYKDQLLCSQGFNVYKVQ